MTDIGVEKPELSASEMTLAEQLIDQYRADGYDAAAYQDEETERVLAAIDQKVEGKQITVAPIAGMRLLCRLQSQRLSGIDVLNDILPCPRLMSGNALICGHSDRPRLSKSELPSRGNSLSESYKLNTRRGYGLRSHFVETNGER
jgi:hypothetical protein